MKLESIKDPGFREYGQPVQGYDFSGFLKYFEKETPRPADHNVYVPSDRHLEKMPVYKELRDNHFGGMPIQIGYCNGFTTSLNAIEYHKGSEVIITVDDIILLLAKLWDIDSSWNLDASKVRAFLVPAGAALEIYGTTLHYSPCAVSEHGYQVAIVLPKGTNQAKPRFTSRNAEDKHMTAANKWLIAHPDAKTEIADGALIGIKGTNPDVRQFWKKTT